jgi:hypothetical protein
LTLRPFTFSGVSRPVPGAAPNAVIAWAEVVQQAIHGPAAPRSAGTAEILHTMVHLAVYDAVVAIEGGSRAFAAAIVAAPDADVRAAVATAAYLTARPRLAAAHLAAFDRGYAACIAGLAGGDGVTAGVRVGQQAADAMLALRATDGFGAGDVPVGRIRPFTLPPDSVRRPEGPAAHDATAYARDIAETRDMGGAASTRRSAEQTDIAWFWAENPYVHWNRNLMALAHSKGLDLWRTARLFAMVHTAASDAIIAGCGASRTTVGEGAWSPLVRVDDPDGSCGHGCWAAAVVASVAACFGGLRLEWTLTTSKAAVPALIESARTYRHLIELLAEIGNACVCSGCQCRHALRDAAVIGGRVAAHVQWHHFQQTR